MFDHDSSRHAGAAVPDDPERDRSQRTLTHVLYALHGLSALSVGIFGVVAVIINYLKLRSVRGTLYESHFRWQIWTFWCAVAGFVVGRLLLFFVIGRLLMLATVIWALYRIVRGWLTLNDGRPIDAKF